MTEAFRLIFHARSNCVILAAAVLVCTQGCATYLVRSEDAKEEAKWRGGAVHSFFGGISHSPTCYEAKSKTGISEVKVEDNLLFDILGVATLGAWQTIRVSFRNAETGVDDGSQPTAHETTTPCDAQCCDGYIIRSQSPGGENQLRGGTMHALFWGMYKSPAFFQSHSDIGMHGVVVQDNFFYDLTSVVTLGIWKPLDLRFREVKSNGP